MKSYLSLFRIRMIKGLQYRTVALGSILMRFCWGLMEILAFSSIHKTGGSFSMTFSQTASYIWVQQAFLLMYNVIDGDQEIEASIHDGSIAYELARPMNLYGSWYTQCLANHEVSASWTLPPEPCGHLSMHTALHMPSTNKISLFRVSHGDTPGILPAFSCDSLA